MKAVRFHFSIPRYLGEKAARKVSSGAYWKRFSCTRLEEVGEPALPGPEWVKVRTIYGGICGTDISAIDLHTSLYYSPFSSFPFTFGHEAVGTAAETGPEVDSLQPGDRVVLEPLLWCTPRGFSNLCPPCAAGRINQCQRVVGSSKAPGLMVGFSSTTGGSWSPVFTAHQSQLYRVPDNISNENAIMVEPLATGLHAVLLHPPADSDVVLVIGAGTVGLMVTAALKALGCRARTLVLARYPHQAEAAARLGADEVVMGRGDYYRQIAELTGAELHKATLGKPSVVGGVDHTFVCSGGDAATDDALRLTRSGGTVTLVSAPIVSRSVDWSPFLHKELTVKSSYAYHHAEQYQGRTCSTIALALELLQQGRTDLGSLITHRFQVEDFEKALRLLKRRGQSQAIKAVFEFNQ
jgi:L-iditol 2-dehydrogenase